MKKQTLLEERETIRQMIDEQVPGIMKEMKRQMDEMQETNDFLLKCFQVLTVKFPEIGADVLEVLEEVGAEVMLEGIYPPRQQIEKTH